MIWIVLNQIIGRLTFKNSVLNIIQYFNFGCAFNSFLVLKLMIY